MDKNFDVAKILNNHEARISKLESMFQSPSVPQKDDVDGAIPRDLRRKIALRIDTLRTASLVTVVLKFHGSLSKKTQIELLNKLGKKEADSLKGGNYNRDVVNKGFVHKIASKGKDTVYTLTDRGEAEADRVIEEMKKD